MKKIAVVFIVCLFAAFLVVAQNNYRRTIHLPDMKDYKIMKCDFHMHTVFSDGLVWPTVRVDEAWSEGLDAIAITDHVGSSRFKDDIRNDNCNRSYDVAKNKADEKGIILIKGGEITKDMPPGHSNALFVDDLNKLNVKDWREAFKAAKEQKAFIFWNHPWWKAQQPDSTRWFPEHTEMLNSGYMQGVEVVNNLTGGYSPEAHKIALQHNLTFMGNNDIHDPIDYDLKQLNVSHRAMTLVFVKDKSAEGIREALLSKRTIVYFEDKLIGREDMLKPFFYSCVSIDKETIQLKKAAWVKITFTNNSDISFYLSLMHPVKGIFIPEYYLTIQPNGTSVLSIGIDPDELENKSLLSIPFICKNLISKPGEAMPLELTFKIDYSK